MNGEGCCSSCDWVTEWVSLSPKGLEEHDLDMTLVIKYRTENPLSLLFKLSCSAEYLGGGGAGFPSCRTCKNQVFILANAPSHDILEVKMH